MQDVKEKVAKSPVEEKKTNILKHKRRRLGDRKDGYKLRTVNPMIRLMPYIMPQRCDAQNTYADSPISTPKPDFLADLGTEYATQIREK